MSFAVLFNRYSAIEAPEAWTITTGEEVLCAVVDTGIDLDHPDLKDNLWTNPGEIPNNGIDDDQNGYIDDIHGVDFTDQRHPTPQDGYGHGTHVTGIIAARGNNAQGITGVNWQGQLMALRIFDDKGAGGWASYAMRALDYVVQMGAKCSNHSWGGGIHTRSAILQSAIDRAEQADHLIIAAAGNDQLDNDRFPFYPANYPSDTLISVCATDHRDERAYFSNKGGRSVDLCAPGSNIHSTLVDGYGYQSGTSMAAPYVTGTATLLWSQNPDLSAKEIKRILLTSVDRKPQLAGTNLTGGRLNLYNALTQADQTTDTLTLTNTSGGTLILDQARLTGNDPSDFEITKDQCSGQTLAANQQCTVRVSFAPKTGGDKLATLEPSAGGSQVSATLQGQAEQLPNSDSATQSGEDADGDGIPNYYDPYPETLAGQACIKGQRYLTLSYTTLTGSHTCEAESQLLTGTAVKIGSDTQGASVTFQAGNAIRLFPGFEVKAGNWFRAVTTGGNGDEPIGGIE